MNCKLSVIIPVYNAEKYLAECLNSIISSSVFGELEVLLIDDGSQDNSGNICDSFSEKYKNIKTFHIENGGVSNARNIALEYATGEYITFCDADDYYVNDILKNALDKLQETNVDILFFEYFKEKKDGSRVKVKYPFKTDVILTDGYNTELFRFMLGETRLNSIWNKVLKKEVIAKNNILFNKEQRRGEDRDYVIRFLSNCKSAYYLSEVGYFYRYVKTSIVNKPQTDYYDNVHFAYKFKVKMAPEFNVMSDELEEILEPAIVKQIVSRTFSSGEYDFSCFSVSMKSLFNNEELMEIVRHTKKIKSGNPAYKMVRAAILTKNVSVCWLVIKALIVAGKVAGKFK